MISKTMIPKTMIPKTRISDNRSFWGLQFCLSQVRVA